MSVTFAVSIDSETCNGFSIADPNDPGMLDVVGFDTATPQLVSDFARGAL
jgi:60 kDa SS-A/Ro ribonucleoprotein